MDQNSTNGAGSDKRNWRERLGIGTRDMPKISDEFKAQAAEPATVRLAPRATRPVTKPAPMAPRIAVSKPVTTAPASSEPRRAPEVQNGGALAERLKAQRAAAEKLAEQRVQAARQRAESRDAAEPALSIPPRVQPADNMPKVTSTAILPKPAAAVRPKFSFADDDSAAPRQEHGRTLDRSINGPQRPTPGGASMAPLSPPRPALGGERSQALLLRPTASPYRADGSSAFRPVDPATGYTPPSTRQVPPGGQRPYPQEPGALPYGANRVPARQGGYEPYGRGPGTTRFEDDPQAGGGRGDPRLARSLAARGGLRAPEPDVDDVFEDEAPQPPRRRASASDYQSAYREAEEGYEEEHRRSSGPLLVLLALLAVAVAGGVVWYYNAKMKTVATTAATDTVPVIAAPEQPAKTAAETSAAGAADTAAVNKKQIYDRIVGDQEVTGDTVVPTEVTPIQPEAVQPDQSETTGTVQPGAADQGQGTEEALPLPLPPAPGQGIQGKLDQGNDSQVVAAAAQPPVEEVKGQPVSQDSQSIVSLLPSTETDQGAADTTQASPPLMKQPAAATTGTATTETTPSTASDDSAAAESTATAEPEIQTPPPPKKQKKTATAKKPDADTSASLGAEPVVLVPPGEAASPAQETAVVVDDPASTTAQAQPAKRKKTLFDLFKGSDNGAAATTQTAGTSNETVIIEPVPEQQNSADAKVAALPETTTTPQIAKPTVAAGTGYLVQLSSFRTQAEAQAEYGVLSGKYPSIIGAMTANIKQSTVGGGTRYQLGLGPTATRDQAAKVCSALLAAGERDCLVRKQQ